MMNKNGAVNILSVMLSAIAVILIFFGLFGYVNENYQSANITDTLGSELNESISEYDDQLNDTVTTLRDKTSDVGEADSTFAQIAWNGLKGIGPAIGVVLAMIDISIGLWNALFPALIFLPIWFKLLVETALVIAIIVAILKAFKGETTG